LKLFKPLTEKIETTTQAIKTLPVLPAIQAAPPLAAIAPPPSAQALPPTQASITTPLASDVQQAAASTTELGRWFKPKVDDKMIR
jgi:hypothetical protein